VAIEEMNIVEWVRHIGKQQFPHASALVLGGSQAIGTANGSSDVDIVVIDNSAEVAYRESVYIDGKPVEWFVFTEKSLLLFFREARRTALPTVLHLLVYGQWVETSHICLRWRSRAALFLRKGPISWSLDAMNDARYELTELLEDLEVSRVRAERLILSHQIADRLIRFILRSEGCWLGEGKWLLRMLQQYNETLASRYIDALEQLCRSDQAEPFIRLADEVLEANGGRWFQGYYTEIRHADD